MVTGDYDDVGTLLSSLGFADYTLVNGIQNSETQDFLSDTDLLGSYDMLFFNGGFTEEGVISDDVLINNVRNYVEAGGTIIVSDWAYDLVETMFPDKMTFVGDDTIEVSEGDAGLIDCRIVDPNMANSIGTDEIQVEFDLPLFPPVLFADPSVSIHMTGNVEYLDPNPIDGVDVAQANRSPVLVSFAHGAGKVVFLSFRIESNDTEDALRIHRYLVFSSSLARSLAGPRAGCLRP